MFFNAILTLGLLTQIGAELEASKPNNTKYFKNSSTITYNVNMPHQQKITYYKVPTKLTKINEKSN